VGGAQAEAVAALRVLVVDDVPDMRLLLRVQFQADQRFDVVGEGADGEEAIELAARLQPDLVILDRQMPRLGGLEAIEGIRTVAPGAAIVLYTAVDDAETHHAALAAGALGVLSKAGGTRFVENFTSTLLDRIPGSEDMLEVRVGPVPGVAARTWIANTETIIAAVASHPHVVDVPADVIELFESLLARWKEVAADAEDFLWVARAPAEDISRIVEQWAIIDAMSDDQLERLRVHWSPPEGQPFFEALTAGVLRALTRHDETQRLAERLAHQWALYQTGTEG